MTFLGPETPRAVHGTGSLEKIKLRAQNFEYMCKSFACIFRTLKKTRQHARGPVTI